MNVKTMNVKTIVDRLGGPAKVARLCGIETTQAVSMWIKRGEIPDARLMYLRAVRPDIFDTDAEVASGETPKTTQEAA